MTRVTPPNASIWTLDDVEKVGILPELPLGLLSREPKHLVRKQLAARTKEP